MASHLIALVFAIGVCKSTKATINQTMVNKHEIVIESSEAFEDVFELVKGNEIGICAGSPDHYCPKSTWNGASKDFECDYVNINGIGHRIGVCMGATRTYENVSYPFYYEWRCDDNIKITQDNETPISRYWWFSSKCEGKEGYVDHHILIGNITSYHCGNPNSVTLCPLKNVMIQKKVHKNQCLVEDVILATCFINNDGGSQLTECNASGYVVKTYKDKKCVDLISVNYVEFSWISKTLSCYK